MSDHDIPYPTPADRKDLESLVGNSWDHYVVSPYQDWDNEKLTGYLQQKGVDTKDSAKAGKDSLVAQVKESWYETEDKAQGAYGSVKDWILDSWTDSQLKAFCDHHGIPGTWHTASWVLVNTDTMQFLNLAPVTPFSPRFAPATTPSPKRLARLLPTPETGSTPHGLVWLLSPPCFP